MINNRDIERQTPSNAVAKNKYLTQSHTEANSVQLRGKTPCNSAVKKIKHRVSQR